MCNITDGLGKFTVASAPPSASTLDLILLQISGAHNVPPSTLGLRSIYLSVKTQDCMATGVDFRTIPTEKGARPQYPRPVHPDDIGDPCVIANELSRERFGDSYPNPFTSIGVKDDWGRTEEYDWGDTARTLVEQRMCLLSAHLREKPRWYVKMKDPVIRARWREEALQGMRATPVKEWVLTEKMASTSP